MDKKVLPTEYSESYRTGNVQPPKSHRGLISLLLLLVIFLGSLVSALSFWGIHLFQALQEKEDTSVRFITDMRLSNEEENHLQVSDLGIEGYFLTAFDQRYFDLPQGFYITQVQDPFSDLRPGDILLGINDTETPDASALYSILGVHSPGATLSLDVSRNGARRTLNAVVQKANLQ